jgi:hypothetical protein
MDLLDRYLQAVKWWLPAEQKEDLVTELREDLQSQIDERRAELGREPSDSEISEILKRCGRPILVAGRYLPQHYLIGPTVYPIYLAVVKTAAIICLASWTAVGIGRVVLFRGHLSPTPGEAFADTMGGLWQFGLVAFAAITAVFAAIDRTQTWSRAADAWSPRDLPRVHDPKRIPRFGSVVEMALSIMFMTWWADVAAGFPVWTLGRSGARWIAGPVWQDFHASLYWPLLGLGAVALVLSGVNLVRPYWTRTRLAIRAAGDLVAAVLVSIVIAPHASAVRAEAAAIRAARRAAGELPIAAVFDVLVFMILAVAALVCVCQAIHEVWRFETLRRSESRSPLASGSAPVAP